MLTLLDMMHLKCTFSVRNSQVLQTELSRGSSVYCVASGYVKLLPGAVQCSKQVGPTCSYGSCDTIIFHMRLNAEKLV